jgi:hypothetical protein
MYKQFIPQLIFIFKILICGIFFCGYTCSFAQESSLKLSELNVGLDLREGTYKSKIAGTTNNFYHKNYEVHWRGVSARLQSSFVAEYAMKNLQKKFKYGDIIAAEIGFGLFNSDSTGNEARFNYRFDFGFGCVSILNPNHEIGATFLILKFTNDGTIPNGSGSSVTLRYRYKNLIIEPCLDAHRQRIIGWLQGLEKKNNLTLQASIIARVNFKDNHQFGLRYETLPINGIKYEDYNMETQSRSAIRIFYGLIF